MVVDERDFGELMGKHAMLMSVAEAAALSGMSGGHIRRMLQRGELGGYAERPMRVSPSSCTQSCVS